MNLGLCGCASSGEIFGKPESKKKALETLEPVHLFLNEFRKEVMSSLAKKVGEHLHASRYCCRSMLETSGGDVSFDLIVFKQRGVPRDRFHSRSLCA